MMGIRPGGLDHPAVIDLLDHHLAESTKGIPTENAHALGAAGLAKPGISFFAAWQRNGESEELLGIAALRSLGVDHGEIKSMRTAPAHLGKGVGRALLKHLIATARARGYRQLSLETGTADRFQPAIALYRSAGFVDATAYGDYPASEHNLFMTLELT